MPLHPGTEGDEIANFGAMRIQRALRTSELEGTIALDRFPRTLAGKAGRGSLFSRSENFCCSLQMPSPVPRHPLPTDPLPPEEPNGPMPSHKQQLEALESTGKDSPIMHCQGPAPAGSRGTLRMNSIGERETRRTGLDRAKSARERERKKERDQTRNMQQSLAVALFLTVAFIP